MTELTRSSITTGLARWLVGGLFAVTIVPLLAILVVLPFAGRVAFAFQHAPDLGLLAPARMAGGPALATGPLSSSTMSFPSQTVTGKVTGGGTIFGQSRNFGFVAQGQVGPSCPASGCPAKGNLNYVNHTTGVHIDGKVDAITSFMFTNTGPGPTTGTATFTGIDKQTGCRYTVSVTDNGEPGTNDKFGLDCGSETTSGQQTLSGGNIQIHPTQAQ